MPPRSGLGKGLDALIPTGQKTTGGEGGITHVAVDSIQRNPRQPREKFDLDELEEPGRIHPRTRCDPAPDCFPGKKWDLHSYRRRTPLAGCRKAGLKTVPVVIRHATDQQLLELALIENVQRADLNAIEEAEPTSTWPRNSSCRMKRSQTRVGKSRVAVTNTLRLLDASAAVKQALVDGRITEGHACPTGADYCKGAGNPAEPDRQPRFERPSDGGAARKYTGQKTCLKKRSSPSAM